MANDRVMMRCDGCRAWKMMLRHFPGDLGTKDGEGPNKFIAWVNEHCECHPHFWDSTLQDVNGFSLHCEGSAELDPEKQNLSAPEREII
jgi:hypothetical protein